MAGDYGSGIGEAMHRSQERGAESRHACSRELSSPPSSCLYSREGRYLLLVTNLVLVAALLLSVPVVSRSVLASSPAAIDVSQLEREASKGLPEDLARTQELSEIAEGGGGRERVQELYETHTIHVGGQGFISSVAPAYGCGPSGCASMYSSSAPYTHGIDPYPASAARAAVDQELPAIRELIRKASDDESYNVEEEEKEIDTVASASRAVDRQVRPAGLSVALFLISIFLDLHFRQRHA